MKLDYKPYLSRLIDFAVNFRHGLIGGAVVLVLLFAILRINQHSSVELNQQRYDEEISTVKRVDFDQDTIQKILDLNDLNVDIESIFPDSRNNPFN